MTRLSRIAWLLMFVCAGLFVVAGCDDASGPKEEDEEVQEVTNPNLPNANDLIVSETWSGDPEKRSTIWEMDGNRSDGFFFEGLDDNLYCTGMLAGGGAPVWSQAMTFRARGILAADNARFTGAVAVGSHEPADGPEYGVIALVGPDGTVQDQLTMAFPSADLRIQSATLVVDSILLCVGGADVDGSDYPLLGVAYIRSDGTLAAGDMTIVHGLSYERLFDVAVGAGITNTQTGETLLDCYVAGVKEVGGEETIALHALRCPVDSLANSVGLWSRTIVAYQGMNTRAGDGLAFDGAHGTLYIAGRTDVNKTPAPSNGGYWDAGVVASVSTGGDVNWVTPVVLTQYSDFYYGVCATGDALYAAGRYSAFWKSGTDHLYGYGLLSKFDPATGDAEYHLSFGDKTYDSGFNAVRVEGTTASAAGWTRCFTNSGGSQNWFAEIDLSAAAPATPSRGEAGVGAIFDSSGPPEGP